MQKFKYRAPRFLIDLPVRLTSDGTSIAGRCREISKDGMKLELPQPLPHDYTGTVSLCYQDVNLEIGVRIAHTGAHEDGVKFVFSSERERAAVASLVALLAAPASRSSLALIKAPLRRD